MLEEGGESAGASQRVVIGIDLIGNIAFRKTYALDEVAHLDEVLAVLEAI